MARQRDYKAEYARRVAKGAAEGKSRQASRGHSTTAGRTEYRQRQERKMTRLATEIRLGEHKAEPTGQRDHRGKMIYRDMPTHQALGELIAELGPGRAMRYLEIQRDLQDAYKGYESQGTIDEYVEDLHDLFYEAGQDYPDDDWFYYH